MFGIQMPLNLPSNRMMSIIVCTVHYVYAYLNVCVCVCMHLCHCVKYSWNNGHFDKLILMHRGYHLSDS